MTRIVLVHGWGGSPKRNWFPWLRSMLEARGFQVIAPELPHTKEPRKERWVPVLAEAVGTPDAKTYFIAHSLGGQALVRYFESLPEDAQTAGALFVASFFTKLENLEGRPIEEEIAASWLNAPLDLAKVRTHLPKVIACSLTTTNGLKLT